MRLQKKNESLKLFLGFICFVLFESSLASSAEFRTPAKRFAGAYSVKMGLKNDLVEYVIPLWIKPDQVKSSLDPVLMKDLGYTDRSFVFSSVMLSGFQVGKTTFNKMPSEWAFVPDFSKNCCFGVIGQDLLSRFEIRFVPGNPTHLEWKKLDSANRPTNLSPAFREKIKNLFSLQKTIDVPFVLNLSQEKLIFEGKPPVTQKALFTFFFIPPDRHLKIQSVDPAVANKAKKSGLQSGVVITEINGKPVSKLDRWEVEKFLNGENSSTIHLKTSKNLEVRFHFDGRKFE